MVDTRAELEDGADGVPGFIGTFGGTSINDDETKLDGPAPASSPASASARSVGASRLSDAAVSSGPSGLLGKLNAWLVVPAVELDSERFEVFAMTTWAMALALVSHVGFFSVFALMGQEVLAAYNLLSIAVFIAALVLARRARLNESLLLGVSEVIVHAWLATAYLGWASSFHLHVLLGLVLSVLRMKQRIFVAALVGATYLPLTQLEHWVGVLSPVPEAQLRWLSIVNTAIFVVVLAGICLYYTHTVHLVRVARVRAEEAAAEAKARAAALVELGSYRLGTRIGEGGMGEVWTAHHQMLARPAAIKLIRAEHLGKGSETIVARFTREAQATAKLRSPHTVELFDFGRTDDGTFYYVMELLDGVDLQGYVDTWGPMPPARVIHVLRQACASLAEAHDVGLVHRDIKPANVFLCHLGGEYDFVKLLDFGLVTPSLGSEPRPVPISAPVTRPAAATDIDRTLQDGSLTSPGTTGNSDLTRGKALMGTPAYMAPEQAMGQRVDGRSDIYALGCVAYWLLTGERVFKSKSSLAMVESHVEEQPLPPSERAGTEIPAALEDLVLQMLAKDPTERPESAEAIARELEALAGQQLWTQAQARAWWERERGDEDKPMQTRPPGDAPVRTIQVRA